MANYPQELAQDALCHSHTGHMTGLWFLPAWPLTLNTSDDDPVSNCFGRGPLVLLFSSVDLDADIVCFQFLDSAHLAEPYGRVSL